jgi:hypothetical protein
MRVKQEIDVQTLWVKYEEVAMHFNDLLIRLRTQSLAGIAALAALVGIFSREGIADIHLDWIVAEAIFAAMIAFWIAIWCLDLLYYNRLLSGAVRAVTALERQTKPDAEFSGEIDLSTLIEAEFSRPIWSLKKWRFKGIVIFYGLVLAVLVSGLIFSNHMRSRTSVACAHPSTAAQSLRC